MTNLTLSWRKRTYFAQEQKMLREVEQQVLTVDQIQREIKLVKNIEKVNMVESTTSSLVDKSEELEGAENCNIEMNETENCNIEILVNNSNEMNEIMSKLAQLPYHSAQDTISAIHVQSDGGQQHGKAPPTGSVYTGSSTGPKSTVPPLMKHLFQMKAIEADGVQSVHGVQSLQSQDTINDITAASEATVQSQDTLLDVESSEKEKREKEQAILDTMLPLRKTVSFHKEATVYTQEEFEERLSEIRKTKKKQEWKRSVLGRIVTGLKSCLGRNNLQKM